MQPAKSPAFRRPPFRLVAGNVRRMVPVLWQTGRGLLLAQAVLLAIRAAAPAFSLLLTRRLVDLLTALVTSRQPGWESILTVVGLQAGLELVSTGAAHLHDMITLKQNQRVEHHLQSELIRKATRLPLTEYSRPGFYDKLEQARSGLSFRGVRWLEQAATLIRQLASLLSVLLVIGRVHSLLAVGVTVVAIPAVWVHMRFGGLRFLQMRHQTPVFRQLAYMAECLTGRQGAAELRMFGMVDYLKRRWDRLFWQNANEAMDLKKTGTGYTLGVDMIGLAVGTLTVVFLVSTRHGQSLSVGDFVIAIQAIQTARMHGQSIAFSLSQVFEDALFVTDLFEFLDRPEEGASGAQPFPALKQQGIQVEKLTFRYPGQARYALQNVSLHITPGERVAIVGENGSGKSTLVKCLLGLYAPESGVVRYEGVSLAEIAPTALRANATAIFQDFVPYQLTVRENVALGALDRLDDTSAIEAALELSGAGEFVRGLPDGIDTQLGASFTGVELSRGQWQKLAMARAFFRESQVIAMDEPTASLDPKTEAMIFQQFASLAGGRTALLVSHRLGMCHTADRILVLRRGELVEQGTHAELMALNGEYARMYQLQAGWYESATAGAKGAEAHDIHAAS